MIWSVYDSALREARADYGHERTLHAKSVGAAADEIRDHLREIAALRLQVEQASSESWPQARAPEMWSDLSEAPTMVDMANRREGRPIAIVKTGERSDQARRRDRLTPP